MSAQRLPWAFGAAAVLAQIAYPLTPHRHRPALTRCTVPAFCAASVSHAAATRGARWAARMLGVTAGMGLAVEAVGTRTGVPFGRYEYADSLGRKAFGVPVVIPLAWTMLGYPALLVGRRLTASARLGPVVAGAALAGWDLFLDPQMVAAGHWRWHRVRRHLPGSPEVPVSNYLGWFAVATAVMAVLWPTVPPADDADDRLPAALYLWTYASSVLANVAFWRRPLVGLVGGIGMGATAVPFARSIARQR